jgi:cysteine-rich repeat protein
VWNEHWLTALLAVTAISTTSCSCGSDERIWPKPDVNGGKPSAVCGNGKRERGEACDDGNRASGDGCSRRCAREATVSIDAGTVVDQCPHLESYAASPLQTAVGTYVTLTAAVTDPEGDPWSVRWTASAGNVVLTPEPARAEYRCTVEGRHTLTLTVTDGRHCAQTEQVEVTCVPRIPSCGDGYVDVREECEDGNVVDGDGCSSVCQLEPVCGDGVRHPPEGCDDGNTIDSDGCSSWCQPDDSGLAANRCPRLRSLVVAPGASASLPIDLLAEADDPEDDDVFYLWSASSGAIDDASSAHASYRCGAAGVFPVTLLVSDARGCERNYETRVLCR